MADTLRKQRWKPSVVVYNEVAQDKRLSLEARGLWLLMMALPDDWEFNVGGLAKVAGCGKDRVRRLLEQLENVGYLAREQVHGEKGKFGKNTYILQDIAPPLSGKPDNGEHRCPRTPSTENTFTEKPLTETPTQKNNVYINNNINPPISPQGEEEQKITKKGKRASRYALQEDAKPLLRTYVGSDNELARALADLIEVRELKRAMNTRKGIQCLLSKLDELSKGDRDTKLALLREAYGNGWKSVYPLRSSGPAKPQAFQPVIEEEGSYRL